MAAVTAVAANTNMLAFSFMDAILLVDREVSARGLGDGVGGCAATSAACAVRGRRGMYGRLRRVSVAWSRLAGIGSRFGGREAGYRLPAFGRKHPAFPYTFHATLLVEHDGDLTAL